MKRARDWACFKTPALLSGKDDSVTDIAAVRALFPQFGELIAQGPDEESFTRLRRAETIGRPLGDEKFMRHAERRAGRTLVRGKRGPKSRSAGSQKAAHVGANFSGVHPFPETR